jgi:HlyD family secretion protein
VTVDAFPNRRFTGIVEQVEPSAVVQSSVTMFPVLVSLNNFDGALKPGMNGQVTMEVARHDNVLAVPSDAIRNARDAATVASMLGVAPDSIKAALASARAARGAGIGAASSTPSTLAEGDTSRRRGGTAGVAQAGAGGGGTASSAGRRSGFSRQGGGGAGAAGPGGSGGSGGGGGGMIVFVKQNGKFSARAVRAGISDFDYTEILNGLKPGEQVALLGPAVLQAQREQVQARVRAGTGAGLQQTTTPPAGGGGGGGGGRPPGS